MAKRATNAIGQRIRAFRVARGLTQGELADRVGASEATIVSKWERGLQVPRLDSAQVIADALGVSVEQLVDDSAPHQAGSEGSDDHSPRRPLEKLTIRMLGRLDDRELEAVHALVVRLGEK